MKYDNYENKYIKRSLYGKLYVNDGRVNLITFTIATVVMYNNSPFPDFPYI